MSNQVLQDWVLKLGYYDQAKLLAALRGMDCKEGNEKTKHAVKLFRYLIGNKPDLMVKNNYATEDVLNPKKLALMIEDGKKYSEHWYEHFLEAIKIVSEKHPNCFVRYYWKQVIESIDMLRNNIHEWSS